MRTEAGNRAASEAVRSDSRETAPEAAAVETMAGTEKGLLPADATQIYPNAPGIR